MIRFLLLILLCASNLAKADAKQDASDVVNKMRPSINAGIKGGVDFKGSGDLSIKDMINYKGTDIKETAYKDQATREAAIAAMQKEENDARDVVNTSFLRQKEYKIDKNSPIWDNAKQAQAHPERYVDWIKGNYQDCKQDGADAMLSKEHKVCDEYHAIEERSCIMGRAIVVDSKHKYECTKSLDKMFKRCTKSLIVSTKEDESCSISILSRSGSSLSVAENNENFTVTADVKFRGLKIFMGSDVVFDITNFDKVEKVILEEVVHAYPVNIKLANVQLFTYPNTFILSSTNDWVIERKERRANIAKFDTKLFGQIFNSPVNQDITSLLKATSNRLVIRTQSLAPVVFKLRITKKCEVEKDEWVENCTEVKGAL